MIGSFLLGTPERDVKSCPPFIARSRLSTAPSFIRLPHAPPWLATIICNESSNLALATQECCVFLTSRYGLG